MSFWIKLEFNGDDPTFSGLLGATQVQTAVGQNPQDSEGSQFWIWKNTEGQLRISRLYYHQAFAKGYTSQAIPLIGNEDEEETSGAEEAETDRSESTRLNSSHITNSYAVFCWKKKKQKKPKKHKTLNKKSIN